MMSTTDAPDAPGRHPVAEVWALAWPTVITMLSYTLMQFVDSLMVAQVGQVEVAAQGNGAVWSFAPIVMIFGILSIVNTFVSQSIGAKRPHEVARYAWAGIWVALLGWALFLVPFGLSLPWLFGAMGHDARLTELETDYCSVLIFGGVATVLGKAVANFFFGIQRPAVITVAAITGNLVNFGLNYVLIYGSLGLPSLGLPGVPGVAPMGVVGAAIATVCGTAVETAIPLTLFLGRRMNAEFGIRRAWRLETGAIRDLLRVGLPAAMQQGSELVTWAIFMSVLVGSFGNVALAAGWATLRYMHLSFMPAAGFGVACTSIVGRYIGAGRPDIAARRANTALGIAVVYMSVCGALMFIFRAPLIGLFAHGAQTPPEEAAQIIQIGSMLMIAAAFFQAFDAVGIVYMGALRGAGDTLWPGVVTIVLSWTVIVGVGFGLVKLAPGLGPLGPWIAASLYIAIFGVVLALRWRRGAWKALHLLETPEQEAAREARQAAQGLRLDLTPEPNQDPKRDPAR